MSMIALCDGLLVRNIMQNGAQIGCGPIATETHLLKVGWKGVGHVHNTRIHNSMLEVVD